MAATHIAASALRRIWLDRWERWSTLRFHRRGIACCQGGTSVISVAGSVLRTVYKMELNRETDGDRKVRATPTLLYEARPCTLRRSTLPHPRSHPSKPLVSVAVSHLGLVKGVGNAIW